jgi:ABC-2 type transport system ATP-binding protein
MQIIRVENLTRRFGEVEAVHDLSTSVEEGEIFGLVGPNGAGKSTVIRMLTTLLPPTSGSAYVGGFNVVKEAGKVREMIGYVPQMLSADGTLTGRENLNIFAKLYDIPKSERRGRIDDSLRFMGLTDAGDKLVRTYSGGMIRRLEIALSFLHHPKVLFLDEPTVGLDPVARNAVWDHVKRLREDYGTTIFLTTHYMEEADLLCHRVAIMHLGKLAALGSPADLKASVGPTATLDDVFVHYSGQLLDTETGESYREIARTRRTARRVG